jgi:hypothetical protein
MDIRWGNGFGCVVSFRWISGAYEKDPGGDVGMKP